jgi:hypothetical protein
MTTVQENKTLTVSEIARAIARDWKTINPYAAEYLNAMLNIESVEDTYYADSAKSVVLYFLANAGSYRGDNARSYKALLKAMVK